MKKAVIILVLMLLASPVFCATTELTATDSEKVGSSEWENLYEFTDNATHVKINTPRESGRILSYSFYPAASCDFMIFEKDNQTVPSIYKRIHETGVTTSGVFRQNQNISFVGRDESKSLYVTTTDNCTWDLILHIGR